ncbi:MAG: hypothetical protein LBR53_13040 [Deltaproteobacteria bacterium]|nr:hypothetical protein [Deltaproteobacteria bacterium]
MVFMLSPNYDYAGWMKRIGRNGLDENSRGKTTPFSRRSINRKMAEKNPKSARGFFFTFNGDVFSASLKESNVS